MKKSKNFENLRILKMENFWKSKNFENPRTKKSVKLRKLEKNAEQEEQEQDF